MKYRRFFATAAVGLAACSDPVVPASPFVTTALKSHFTYNVTVSELPALAGTAVGAEAIGINADGWIVGRSITSSGAWHATLWRNGVPTDLGVLRGGTYSAATDVNNLGQVVGYGDNDYGSPVNLLDHGFLWENGALTVLDTAACHCAWRPAAINDLGQIGGASTSNGGWYNAGFPILDGSVIQAVAQVGSEGSEVTDLDNNGAIVGAHIIDGISEAYRLSGGVVTNLPMILPGGGSRATAMNDKGQIVGSNFWCDVNNLCGPGAFLYSNGVTFNLSVLPADSAAQAFGINDNGQVAGYSESRDGLYTAVMWDNGSAVPLPAPNFVGAVAMNISANGQIVGVGWDASGQSHALLWSVLRVADTPAEQVAAINSDVTQMAASGDIASSQAQALIGKLDATTRMLNNNDTQGAINLMSAFINQVRAFVKAGKVSAADGQKLIDEARALISSLGG